jgi:hypothetical protein
MRNVFPPEYNTIRNHRLYNIWRDMLRRCSPGDREDQMRYYAKGIRVCKEWENWPTFAQFAFDNGYEPGLTIDRKDNSKGYEPENCRFVTMKVQHHNRDLVNTYRRIKEGQTLHWAKEFICVETGDRFLTQIEAHRKYGIDRKSLRDALSGKHSQAGGYHWRYVEASG